jgi:hypothetical protein
MMGSALVILGWISTIGFLGTGVIGWLAPGSASIGLHILAALLTSLLLLFSHCWIMFYLIGTGKALRLAVEEHHLDQAIIEETKRFKNLSYPWLMAAMGFAMATFILGGGVPTGAIPKWVHQGLFLITLAVQVRTVLIEQSVLSQNWRLLRSTDRKIID